MDLYLDGSYINAKDVYSAFLNYRPEKKTVITGRFWWKKVTEENVSKWEITMSYLSGASAHADFKCTGSDEKTMRDMFKSLMEQLKTNGAQWADKVLEEAIINGGTK